MAVPIWRDTDIDLSAHLTGGVVDFSIELNSNAIYHGRAVAAPDGSCSVRINDICAPFLGQTRPIFPLGGYPLVSSTPADLAATFDVTVGGSVVASVTFIADWSYNDIVAQFPSGILSDPVHDWVADGQPLPLTLYQLTGSLTTPDGVTVFGNAAAASNVLMILDTAAYPGNDFTLRAGDWSKSFRLRTDVCWSKGLLYVNAFGGWDFLPMPGTTTRQDAYAREQYERRISNTDRAARAAIRTVNDITRSWTLRTGNLTDTESARMHHLLASQDVYLYDITDGLQPVTITDSACDYKTSRVERSAVEYAITVQLAQRRMRR